MNVRSAFDDLSFIFDLKHDGSRALAHIKGGVCRLISRRGNVYKSFALLRELLAALNRPAVLDGEIVVLDAGLSGCILPEV
jgi:bifunctional non-homologous end joining protein LigD